MARNMYDEKTIEELFRGNQSRAVITRVRPERQSSYIQEMTFYDRNGKPVAYTEDGENIYTFSGVPCAYIYQDKYVYSYNGRHLGWFNNGWVRDLNGACVFFTDNAGNSGLFKPFRQYKPYKAFKQARPYKTIREAPYNRPANMMMWSEDSGEQFFAKERDK